MPAKRGPSFKKFVLNCNESTGKETDWNFADAVIAQSETSGFANLPVVKTTCDLSKPTPTTCDLREDWWKVRDQGKNGACVGFATADGVLRWLYVNKNLMKETDQPSPRFIWMANKETDDLTRYPTTFLESAGTSTKLALGIAQKYGCVTEKTLPMDGRLSKLRANVFFSIAAQFRISAYYNLKLGDEKQRALDKDLANWRAWIARMGPVLTRLEIDPIWKQSNFDGNLDTYNEKRKMGGHAVCLVGYTKDKFIIRNSWGTKWGDKGFAYATDEYVKAAFTEAYGAVI